MKRILLSFAIVVGLVSGYASAEQMRDSGFNWNLATGVADQAIKQAKSENKRARKVGFEWRDTGKMIKTAVKLVKAGKIEEAVKLANKARRQAINAQHQALVAKDAGPHLF